MSPRRRPSRPCRPDHGPGRHDGLRRTASRTRQPGQHGGHLNEGAHCNGHFNLPSRAITFEGAGTGATLDGQGESQILSGSGVGNTTIRNLTFVDGQGFNEDGGAIQLEETDSSTGPTIEGNTFLSNHAGSGSRGGAVALSGNPNQDNKQARGGGGSVVLRDNAFGGPDEGNFAPDGGGAVYIEAFFRTVTVEDNAFSDNESGNDRGGGPNIVEASRATLTGNQFSRNQAGDDGGGASVDACVAEITGNVFTANRIGGGSSSLNGGGLFLTGTSCFATLTRGDAVGTVQAGNRFRGNAISGADYDGSTSGHGAGESIQYLDVISTSDRYVGNEITDTTTGYGGGLSYTGFSSTPLVARNLVATGNEIAVAPQQIPSRGAFPGDSMGGGAFLSGNGQDSAFEIQDATIQGNTALGGSGISGERRREGLTRAEAQTGETQQLDNSIVFGNTGASDVKGNLFDGEIDGFTDARDVRSSDVCVEGAPHADGDPNSNVCVDPQLKGPATDENVDQTATSPTIDAGDNSLVAGDLSKDYAGDGRKLGAQVDMGADEYKPPTVEPEPTPTPTAQTPAPPAPQGAVQGQTQRSCTSKRVFRIRIRVPRGKKARSAVVRVNHKKVKVVRGKRLRAPVRLRGLPKGKFTVKITVRLTNGKKITGKRTYHTCIPKLPGDGPPRV